jgi:LacI family transcriptional regulator
MDTKRVVMKDVARRANVHQTTVSLALNNDPRIAQSTRERIQQIAKEMGYVPDPALSSLVSYRRGGRKERLQECIALVFDIKDPENFERSEYLPTIKEVTLSRAQALGYKVEVFIKGVDFVDSAMLNRVLTARGIRAVLLGAIYDPTTQIELDWEHFSVVKIGSNPMELDVDTVMGNYFYGCRKIMRKLKEAGYQRPAMAGSVRDERNTRDAYSAGFLFGQHRHFDPANHIPFYAFEWHSNEQVESEIYEWLRVVKPDVFISYYNNLIQPVLRLNREDGQPCRFVCSAGDSNTIRVGGIRNNYQQMAQTAVDLLAGKMRHHETGLPHSSTLTLVDSEWHDLAPWPPTGIDELLNVNR